MERPEFDPQRQVRRRTPLGANDPDEQLLGSSQPTGTYLIRRRYLIIAGLVCAAVVFVAVQNFLSASEWQEQAKQQNALARQWQATANENAQIADTVKKKLARSERDVTALADRQSELANEKAQVEDQKEALALQTAALTTDRDALGAQVDTVVGLANTLLDCRNNTNEVLQSVLNDIYTIDYYELMAPCRQSDLAIDSYKRAYE